MEETCKFLPQEIWELIFNFVDDSEAISLVCKEFYCISNRIRRSLTVYNPSIQLLSRHLKRFRHLTHIDLSTFRGDIEGALLEIARSGLDLEALDIPQFQLLPVEGLVKLGLSMKNLKILKCRYAVFEREDDLIVTISAMPRIEELDISFFLYTISDAVIEGLSSKLPELRRINITGNKMLSDDSLIALSSSCKFLREIKAQACDYRLLDSIGFVLSNAPNLVYISLGVFGAEFFKPYSSFPLADSFAFPKFLHTLELRWVPETDSILSCIAKARPPLKRVSLKDCYNFSNSGLSLLLHACRSSLEELVLFSDAEFLSDKYTSDLCSYLCKLKYIRLDSCCFVNTSTFFTLAKNCPFLEEIEMIDTGLGAANDFVVYPDVGNKQFQQIKVLRLAFSKFLNNKLLIKLGRCCPSLQLLDVSYCHRISSKGIKQILKSCKELRQLEIGGYRYKKIFQTDSALSELKLEGLIAPSSFIDDEGIAMIGKSCPELLYLVLETSHNLTDKGVKSVMENCTKLREINLERSCNISNEILEWMVSSCPLLRKVVPPCRVVPDEDQEQEDLLLRHGYLNFNSYVSRRAGRPRVVDRWSPKGYPFQVRILDT